MLHIKLWVFYLFALIVCFSLLSFCGANGRYFYVPFIHFFLSAEIKIVAFLDIGILRKKYIFFPRKLTVSTLRNRKLHSRNLENPSFKVFLCLLS